MVMGVGRCLGGRKSNGVAISDQDQGGHDGETGLSRCFVVLVGGGGWQVVGATLE